MYSFLVPDPQSYHASALSPTPHCREKHGDTSSQIAPRFIGSDSVLNTGLRAAEPRSSEPRGKPENAVYSVQPDRLGGRKQTVHFAWQGSLKTAKGRCGFPWLL